MLFIVRCASKIKTTLCFTISECSPGYTGIGCTLRCPYPLFGQICKEVCKCSKMECSFVSGCLNGKGNWLFTHERTFHPYQKVEKYGGINPPPPLNAGWITSKMLTCEMIMLTCDYFNINILCSLSWFTHGETRIPLIRLLLDNPRLPCTSVAKI